MPYAPGIQRKGDRGRPTEALAPGQSVSYFLQRHRTRRNPTRPHLDLRLGTPDTGLFSWAVPAGALPSGKEKRLAPQTEVHDYGYGPFEGRLGNGYGAGEVRLQDRGDAVIHKVTPHSITFTLAHTRAPMRYSLVRMDTEKGNEWLLMAKNPKGAPEIGDKPVVRVIDAADMDEAISKAKAVQEKIDGAHTIFDIGEKGDIEAYSIRRRSTGDPIVHTERLGLSGVVAPDLAKTRFRGETFGVDPATGAAKPFKDLSGILNATLSRSKQLQAERNMALKIAPFKVTQFKGEDVSGLGPDEQRALLEQIAAALPADKVQLPRRATTPEDKRRLAEEIRSGRNPTTREGLILDVENGQAKIKFRPETTGYLRGTFPGAGRRAATAGGLLASLEPAGEPNIRLGTGFTDAELADIIKNLPSGNMGKPIRINYQEKFPSGKLRAPSFGGFETDKSAQLLEKIIDRVGTVSVPTAGAYRPGYATNALVNAHGGLPWPVRKLTQGHVDQARAGYETLNPNARRLFDTTMSNAAMRYNDRPVPLRAFMGEVEGALPPVFQHPAVERAGGPEGTNAVAMARVVNGLMGPQSRPQPPRPPQQLAWNKGGAEKRAVIRREGGKWVLRTKDGSRVLGTHASKQDAYRQEYAIQMNKGAVLLTKRDLAEAAKAVDTKPTAAQIEAGNYAKGHVKIQGLDITIENPKGSVRSGVGYGGKKWSNTMRAHYGYIKRTEAADGEHVDVFVGPHPNWRTVFVVNQNRPNGDFDEVKVMLGYRSADDAKAGYLENYDKGWRGFGGIVSMSIDKFKEWLASGDSDGRAEKAAALIKEVPMQVISSTLDRPKAEFVAEIADTAPARRKGLSKRAGLPDGRGMFFDIPGPFWMKDVDFPLDLVHLTKSGEITDIQTMLPELVPDFMKRHYGTPNPEAAYAVELPGGWCSAHGVRPGDRLAVGMPKIAEDAGRFSGVDAAAAAAAGALPATSLLQYHATTRPAIERALRQAKVFTYAELERKLRLGDVGVAGMGKTDYPFLVRGSEVAGGNPLAHGFIVGRKGRIYHGGSNYIPLHAIKGVRNADIGRLQAAVTTRGMHGAIASRWALLDAWRAAKAADPKAKLKAFANTWQARQRYYNGALDRVADVLASPKYRRGAGARRVFTDYIHRSLRTADQPGRVTMVLRPTPPLSAAQKAYVHRQLTADAPAYYSTGNAIRAALKKVFLPTLPSSPLPTAQQCLLSNAAGHQCGSLPAKILRGLGLTGRRAGKLPVELLDNPNLKVIGMAGRGSRARALAHLARVARWRTAAGLAAAGLAATGAGVASREIRRAGNAG